MASAAPALHPVAQLAAAAAPPQLVASYRPGPPVGADLLARSGPRVLSSAGTSASSGAGMASGADRSSGSDGGGAYARPREVSTREPGDDSAALPTGAATAAPPEASTVDLSTLHVLLVDDERLSRMVAANLLKKCGYKVTALDSAAGAMEALEADPSAYSMVRAGHALPPRLPRRRARAAAASGEQWCRWCQALPAVTEGLTTTPGRSVPLPDSHSVPKTETDPTPRLPRHARSSLT